MRCRPVYLAPPRCASPQISYHTFLELIGYLVGVSQQVCRIAQELCAAPRVPVFRDCISYLTITRHGERAAFCVPGLFETPVSDRKVQLLRQAYQLGRNPLRMLSLQDPRSVWRWNFLVHSCFCSLSVAWLTKLLSAGRWPAEELASRPA